MYGKTWSCPPGFGTIAECRERLQNYDKLLVFSGKYNLEDSFDYEGMMEGIRFFLDSCRKLAEQAKINYVNGKKTVSYFGELVFYDKDM